MSQDRVVEVRELLLQLERRIRPLEWDLNRKQINEFKRQELIRLKDQHFQLQNELTRLRETNVPEPKLE